MKRNRFPAEWNENRAHSVLEHYEKQTENEAVADDEAHSVCEARLWLLYPNASSPK
jgi:hypothetical protein